MPLSNAVSTLSGFADKEQSDTPTTAEERRFNPGAWSLNGHQRWYARLSFPRQDPGREVFQPNAAVGLCHGRASLPARRLHRPYPADRWSSRAPIPPCSSQLFPQCHVNAALFMTTCIAFMAYLSSLTGIRRRAFADARARPERRRGLSRPRDCPVTRAEHGTAI